MSLFSCRYIAWDGTDSIGVFNENQLLDVVPPGKNVMRCPYQKRTNEAKAWLYFEGCPFPYALTETREEFFKRTNIRDLRVHFAYVADKDVLPVTFRKTEIVRIVDPKAEEIMRIMSQPDGHVEDPRIGSYLFTKNRMLPVTERPEQAAEKLGLKWYPMPTPRA